ncbi:MAG: LamG-like jellyroll fold domain-containing protein, partial [Candidatus Omnitrophota bacterium]|nr:LamG-like jellyroll fold domain-containing protein [Candidatus Omnitrophota bacterium]
MKKLIFRVVALTVIFSHLSTLCLRDISLAAPVAKSSNSNTNQAASTQATAKSAKDNSTSSAPPANPESAQKSSKKSLGGSSSSGSSTPSAAGLNTGALQALQADPFTGRAVFSLPIYVPQGRRGIQPNISLTYSSGAGNGPLGVGWSLELGAIERSTKKGAPKYDDNSDTFVFNSGGSSSELVSIGSGQYRAKIEGAFMRFQFNGSSWTVTDKSGTKYFFGQDASSRIEDGSRKFKWALDKVLDLHGNYLSAIYAKDQNQLYPEKIQYTGNEPAGLSPLGLVEFEFDERSDTSINYRPGFKLVTGRRLTDIKVRFNQKQISRYQLDYATSGSSQSLLNSFTQFGADDSSTLPAITFDYQQPSPGWDLSGQRLPDKYGSFDSSTVITDVNNDGFPDIVANSRGTFLGTKDGSWQETTFWKFPAGHSIGPGTRLTDIDADGWVDMIEHVHGEGGGHSFVIYLNNRQNGWQRNSAWEAKFPGEAYFSFDHGGRWADPTGAQLADVNGDGLVDYLQAKWDGRYVWLGTGSTWKSDTTYTTPVDTSFYDGSTQLGDLNGDGLSDLLVARAERKAVYLNTGSGWQRTPEFDPPSDSVIDFVNGSTQLVDINADGLADLVVAKSGTQRAYLNRGPKLGWQEDGSYRLPEGDFSNSQTRLADSKARGSLDILINQSSNQNKVYLNRANSPANYLSKITNGIGGELSIAYKPSTQFDNTAGDGTSGLPFPVYAVDTLTIHDSVNSDNPDITTRYEYKGGLFDFSEREFRGFAYVKTIDAEGNFSETYFKQGLLDKGRPYRQVARASSGNLYAKTLNTWDTTREPYPGVYFVRLTQTDSYGYDGASSEGGANFKHTQTTFAYDDYGNSTRVTTGVNSAEHPETISDTKTQVSEYAYNTADWLVAAPKRSYLLGNQNPQALNEKRFYYDQQIDFNAPPKKGLLTQEAVLVLNPLTQAKCYAINQYRYDAFGNLIKSVGPLGRVTATAYDSFTQSYPIKVTNPLGQSIENIYYGINDPPLGALDGSGLFGQLKSTQDLNQQRVYSLYDTFGRLTKVIGPLDSLEYPATLYEYDLSSAPIKISQYVKFTSEQTSQPYYASYSFFDGLGRAIYSKTPAQADPQTSVPRQIISGITRYNAKGQVIEKYLPYFTEESPDYVSADYSTLHTSFTYDGLGRVTQTTNPDQTYSSASYSVWEAASIDSNGHKTNKRFDSWGRIAQVEEFTGADGRSADYSYQPYQLYATTRYLYDALGNLIQLTDNQNNTTRIWYDSLGRKLRMSDPDMGIWSYEYDLVGNLIRQTDAKAQKLVFTYDGLNRLVSKALEKRRRAMQLKRDSESETLVTYIYDAPVSLKPNCIGRLSQVIDQSGSTEFFYDNLGREVKSIKSLRGASASSLSLRGAVGDKAISYTVERGYDPLGRLTNLKYPDSGIVKYEYNPQGIERVLKGDSLKEKTVYASTASGADQGTVPDNFTKLLWHADTIGSLTAHGGAKIDTAQKKSGLGSAFFDGKDDYFTLPDSPDWTFGKDDFTIDFWVKFNSLDGDKYIMICGQRVDDRNLWYIYYHYDNKWSVCATIDGKSQIGAFLGGGPPELNTWYHIAIVRNNNKLLLFINGVLNSFNYGSDITGADLSDINSDLSIGSAYNNAGGGGVRGYFNGWIDDFRITKSLARWTESFNPESEGTIPAALEGTIPATAGSGVDQGTVPKVHISKITYLPTGQIAKITYGNATETNYTYDPQTLRLTNLTTEGSAGSTAEAVPPDEGTVPAAVGSGVDQGTPPAGEAGVPDSFTKLLLHVDSLERSGSSHLLPDSSSANHPAALHGNARLDTTEKKFGLSSVFFDGQNSYLSLGTSPDWSFGSEDFTIDLWVKFKDLAGHPAQSFLTQENGRTPGKWGFWDFSYNNGKLHLTFVDDADKDVGRFNVDFSSPATDTWYHFAVEKKGLDCYLFINGVSQQVNVSTPWAATLPRYSGPLYIGCNYTLRAGFLDGWLDEIRVTKGLARWTSNFTPPSAPYNLLDEAGVGIQAKLSQDAIGEPCVGHAQSTNYRLNAGFIPTAQSNPPVLLRKIPTQYWSKGAAKENALNLDDYFVSPDGLPLTYAVSGTSKISAQIKDPVPNNPAKLLLHAEGANGSKVFSDSFGKVVTAYGNARIDTSQSKFGVSSALFDG